MSALAAACRPPYDLLVEVLAYSGLRVGEALALRRESVDLLGGRLLVRESLSEASGQITFQTPKNHQQRAVSLPAFLLRRLQEHLEGNVGSDPQALLFVGATGEPGCGTRESCAAPGGRQSRLPASSMSRRTTCVRRMPPG